MFALISVFTTFCNVATFCDFRNNIHHSHSTHGASRKTAIWSLDYLPCIVSQFYMVHVCFLNVGPCLCVVSLHRMQKLLFLHLHLNSVCTPHNTFWRAFCHLLFQNVFHLLYGCVLYVPSSFCSFNFVSWAPLMSSYKGKTHIENGIII